MIEYKVLPVTNEYGVADPALLQASLNAYALNDWEYVDYSDGFLIMVKEMNQ